MSDQEQKKAMTPVSPQRGEECKKVELSDEELQKVSGGKPDFQPIVIIKSTGSSSP